jgi:hypothetical protein
VPIREQSPNDKRKNKADRKAKESRPRREIMEKLR